MNIYEKVQEARCRFQALGVKMSGQNKFAGYAYYELSDIIPQINLLARELKFFCAVSFGDIATMTITDAEKPSDSVIFTSPMSTASLKGCHEVQNLGAVETYIRRYLYQTAFEIVESDVLNGTHKPEDKPAPGLPEDFVKVKEALIDYINAGIFDYPDNVDAVIKARNIGKMREALKLAKDKEQAAKAGTTPQGEENGLK